MRPRSTDVTPVALPTRQAIEVLQTDIDRLIQRVLDGPLDSGEVAIALANNLYVLSAVVQDLMATVEAGRAG